ncbi:hypothetical protein BOX15_Mlig018454g1 [Macrostomum lignano]|uniref:Cystatin domain-containing protein n=2 Tax=Macrostomum lignano TaxID=282301 RepID=A0A1I8J7A2_9PLAT|nr:hypothetical protein BOX15_Mlig018454g1 [Macrostomum lignano]
MGSLFELGIVIAAAFLVCGTAVLAQPLATDAHEKWAEPANAELASLAPLFGPHEAVNAFDLIEIYNGWASGVNNLPYTENPDAQTVYRKIMFQLARLFKAFHVDLVSINVRRNLEHKICFGGSAQEPHDVRYHVSRSVHEDCQLK